MTNPHLIWINHFRFDAAHNAPSALPPHTGALIKQLARTETNVVLTDPKSAPHNDPGGIDVEGDGFIVDAALLARLLDVPASEVQALMREGRITSRCEEGAGEHADQFRLTFFHGNRRACVRVDPSGRILARSVIDFGSKAASRAIGDVGRR